MMNKELPKTEIYDVEDEDGTRIRVYENGEGWHSAVFLDEDRRNELVFTYMRKFNHVFSLCPDGRELCMIGGAGYVWPQYAVHAHPEITMDVVDIDPDAYYRAVAYFFLEETPRITPVTADGRTWLETCGKTYDIVINDAFSGIIPVMSLATKEALQAIQRCLRTGGVYAVNIPGHVDPAESLFLQSVYRTACAVFASVIVVRAVSILSDDDSCSYVLFASDSPLRTDDALTEPIPEADILYDRDSERLEREYMY